MLPLLADMDTMKGSFTVGHSNPQYSPGSGVSQAPGIFGGAVGAGVAVAVGRAVGAGVAVGTATGVYVGHGVYVGAGV